MNVFEKENIMTEEKNPNEVMQFPMDFPVKVMGLNEADFQILLRILQEQFSRILIILKRRSHSLRIKSTSRSILLYMLNRELS